MIDNKIRLNKYSIVKGGVQVTPIRILIVDDSEAVLETFPRFFDFEPDMEVIGTLSNGLDALKATKALQPNVILMNYVMPFVDGIKATRHILAELPDVKVIIMSHYSRDGLREEVLESGAKAFIRQPIDDIDDFMDLIRGLFTKDNDYASTT